MRADFKYWRSFAIARGRKADDRGGGGEWGARLRNRLRQLRRVKSYGAAVFAGAKTGEGLVIGGRDGDRWKGW